MTVHMRKNVWATKKFTNEHKYSEKGKQESLMVCSSVNNDSLEDILDTSPPRITPPPLPNTTSLLPKLNGD